MHPVLHLVLPELRPQRPPTKHPGNLGVGGAAQCPQPLYRVASIGVGDFDGEDDDNPFASTYEIRALVKVAARRICKGV